MARAKTSSICEAVVLMAGSGSRLRTGKATSPKPLLRVQGRPVISYLFDALVNNGVTTVHAVVGFEREVLVAKLQPLIPRELRVRFIENRDWQKQNGISALAAADHVTSPFLLTMGDHLFDQALIELLLHRAHPDRLNVAIDRKLDCIFDLDDAMKVQTKDDRLVAIGKDMPNYDAIDIGLFVCPQSFFGYLERSKRNGDCSLAEGVQAMAGDGKVLAIDIGDAWWQDIDTPEMLAQAEKGMGRRSRNKSRTPLVKSERTPC